MSRGTQNLVLLLVGLSTAVMLVKGTYLNYVKPGLLPWLARPRRCWWRSGWWPSSATCGRRDMTTTTHEDEHGHRHQPWLGWLLLVPIAMVAFVVPPPLDARGASAGRRQRAAAARLPAAARG